MEEVINYKEVLSKYLNGQGRPDYSNDDQVDLFNYRLSCVRVENTKTECKRAMDMIDTWWPVDRDSHNERVDDLLKKLELWRMPREDWLSTISRFPGGYFAPQEARYKAELADL